MNRVIRAEANGAEQGISQGDYEQVEVLKKLLADEKQQRLEEVCALTEEIRALREDFARIRSAHEKDLRVRDQLEADLTPLRKLEKEWGKKELEYQKLLAVNQDVFAQLARIEGTTTASHLLALQLCAEYGSQNALNNEWQDKMVSELERLQENSTEIKIAPKRKKRAITYEQ